jgi:hypothetical protein
MNTGNMGGPMEVVNEQQFSDGSATAENCKARQWKPRAEFNHRRLQATVEEKGEAEERDRKSSVDKEERLKYSSQHFQWPD